MEPTEPSIPLLIQWQKNFADSSCKLSLPNNEISNFFIKFLSNDLSISDPLAKFSNILAKSEDVSNICSCDLRSSNTVFSHIQFNFLSDALKKMKDLKSPSIHLISFIQEEYMTTAWRNFYFQAFLQETMEGPADFKLVSRFKEYEGYSQGVKNLNVLLENFNSQFNNIRDFAFVNGNLEDFHYYESLENCQKILEKSANSLEKILLFFRTNHFYGKYTKFFEQLDKLEFPRLQSFRIALGGTTDPGHILLSLFSTHLENAFENNKLVALKDLGIFFANFSYSVFYAKEILRTISLCLTKMESLAFLLQSNLETYTNDDMNQMLSIIFQTKSQTIRNFSLGFCADRQKTCRTTNFTLNHFGNLLKENTWTLLKFQLYYEVKLGLTCRQIKEFLLILITWLRFCSVFKVKLMSNGNDLLEEFGINEILEKYFKTKQKSILMARSLNGLRKWFRREIIYEISEKFF